MIEEIYSPLWLIFNRNNNDWINWIPSNRSVNCTRIQLLYLYLYWNIVWRNDIISSQKKNDGLQKKLRNLLGLELVQLVDLVTHLGDSVVVLLAQVGQGSFVLNVGFLQVTTKFAHLGFAFFVQLDLSGSGAAGFFQTFAQLFQLASQVSPLLLSLHDLKTIILYAFKVSINNILINTKTYYLFIY